MFFLIPTVYLYKKLFYHKKIFSTVISRLGAYQFPGGTIYEPRSGQYREKELDILYGYEFAGVSPTETIPSLTKQIEEEIIKRVEDNVIGDNYIISPFSPFPDSCVFFFDPADFRMVIMHQIGRRQKRM